TLNSGATYTLPGAITGAGALSKGGTGVLTLTGVNTYTGGTVVTAGTLRVGAPGALSSAPVTLAVGSTLDLNGYSAPVSSLAGTGGALANNANTAVILTVGSDNTSTTFAGLITDGTGYPLAVAKVGTGTLTLTGRAANTGGYTVAGGTLEFSGTLVQPG